MYVIQNAIETHNSTIGLFLPLANANDFSFGANVKNPIYIHSKDYFLSYFIGEESHYVSILNSLNTHTGSSAYQCNHILIIDEPVLENSIFESIAHITSLGTIC